MAIITQVKRDVTTSNDFKTKGFRIQASAKAFEILSDKLYKYKVRAIIRELSCNAYDAHIAAGNSDPFKVHLPTNFEQWFSIRDFGTGLSNEQVEEIFTVYFASTKTESNSFVGALGLGSKSPFCLVESFMVTSWYDGTKTIYTCYKDENGEPQCAMLSQEPTDEPNGIEIKLSTERRHIDEFENEAVRVYRFFDNVPDINNKEIVSKINNLRDKYVFIDEQMSITTDYGDLYAVMGNVAYNIPSEFNTIGCEGFIRFDIGDLSFAASREELSLDDNTKNKLINKIDSIAKTLGKLLLEQVDKEPTQFEKALKFKETHDGPLRSIFKKINTDDYLLPVIDDKEPGIVVYSRNKWSRSHTSCDISTTKTLPLGNNAMYFRHKDRFKGRIEEGTRNLRNTAIVILTDEQIDFFGIPDGYISDLETVFPKVSRSSGSSGPVRSKVSVWNNQTPGWRQRAGECWNDGSVTVDNVERVYVEIERYEPSPYSFSKMKDILDSLEYVGVKVDKLYGLKPVFIKTAGFKKGKWVSLKDLIKKTGDQLAKVDIAKYDGDYGYMFGKLSGCCKLIDNFNEMVKLHKDNHSLIFAYEKLGCSDKMEDQDTVNKLQEEILDKYPMLKLVSYSGAYVKDAEFKIIREYLKGENNVSRETSNDS